MRLRLLGYVTWLVVACMSCSLGAVAQDTKDTNPKYQQAIEQAVREFGLGNYAEARALFRKAHAVAPNARTWRGMGMTAFELKLYVEALRELSAALESTARPLTPEQRTQVQALLDQSRSFVGRFQIALTPPTAEVSVDGQIARFDAGQTLLLSIGDHEIGAQAQGYQEVRVPLHVDGAEDLVLRVELAKVAESGAAPSTPVPSQPPAPTSIATTTPAAHATVAPPAAAKSTEGGAGVLTTAGFITLGGAALLGGASTVFWLMGNGQYQKLEKMCGGSCSDHQLATLKRDDVLANVFLGTALAASVTGGVLLILDATRTKPDALQALRLGPTGASIVGSF